MTEENKQLYKLKEKLNCKLKIYIESYIRDNNFTNYLNLYKENENLTFCNYISPINTCLSKIQNQEDNLRNIHHEMISIFSNCKNEELEYILEFLDFVL